MTVFVCGEEFEDILCGIYDAWMSRLGHKAVRIEPEGCDRELFCSYRTVDADPRKAQKVIDAVRNKLSEPIYELIYESSLSCDPYRADKIYRFLIYAFAAGPKVTDMLQIPAVYELFSMHRYVTRESHQMIEFTRFSQMEDHILFGRISPRNDVLPLTAVHFADRIAGENWILYDCSRRKAVVHQADRGWVMVRADSEEWQRRMEKQTDEASFESLWKVFHSSIAITQRTNYKCQRNLLPLRFRPYMTEFT